MFVRSKVMASQSTVQWSMFWMLCNMSSEVWIIYYKIYEFRRENRTNFSKFWSKIDFWQFLNPFKRVWEHFGPSQKVEKWVLTVFRLRKYILVVFESFVTRMDILSSAHFVQAHLFIKNRPNLSEINPKQFFDREFGIFCPNVTSVRVLFSSRFQNSNFRPERYKKNKNTTSSIGLSTKIRY